MTYFFQYDNNFRELCLFLAMFKRPVRTLIREPNTLYFKKNIEDDFWWEVNPKRGDFFILENGKFLGGLGYLSQVKPWDGKDRLFCYSIMELQPGGHYLTSWQYTWI